MTAVRVISHYSGIIMSWYLKYDYKWFLRYSHIENLPKLINTPMQVCHYYLSRRGKKASLVPGPSTRFAHWKWSNILYPATAWIMKPLTTLFGTQLHTVFLRPLSTYNTLKTYQLILSYRTNGVPYEPMAIISITMMWSWIQHYISLPIPTPPINCSHFWHYQPQTKKTQ